MDRFLTSFADGEATSNSENQNLDFVTHSFSTFKFLRNTVATPHELVRLSDHLIACVGKIGNGRGTLCCRSLSGRRCMMWSRLD